MKDECGVDRGCPLRAPQHVMEDDDILSSRLNLLERQSDCLTVTNMKMINRHQ